MFSGIVEEMARVTDIYKYGENVDLTLTCSFASELKIDQSIAHNGVCLTVVKLDGEHYTVTAMKETLDRSNLGLLKVGDMVNVERSMMMNGRLDGHIVQGHVDQTAVCTGMEDAQGSTYFTFSYEGDAAMARRGYQAHRSRHGGEPRVRHSGQIYSPPAPLREHLTTLKAALRPLARKPRGGLKKVNSVKLTYIMTGFVDFFTV